MGKTHENVFFGAHCKEHPLKMWQNGNLPLKKF